MWVGAVNPLGWVIAKMGMPDLAEYPAVRYPIPYISMNKVRS